MSLIGSRSPLLAPAGDEEEVEVEIVGGKRIQLDPNPISNLSGLEEARVWLRSMAALITVADPIPLPSPDSDSADEHESESATCHCCGLTEEYTLAYIAAMSRRYDGRWICGLCSEAVNDEICRSKMLISTEEAVDLHASFCRRFTVSGAPSVVEMAEHFIAAVRQILRRSSDSPRAVNSPAVTRI